MSDLITSEMHRPLSGMEVAIVGMAGRFPGAKNVEEFWRNLRGGVESMTVLTNDELIAAGVAQEKLQDPNYIKVCPGLDDVELFDAPFFGLSPREAKIMDPQQRLFLECAWEAAEQAGYNPENWQKLVGVYGGIGQNNYLTLNLLASRTIGDSFKQYELGIANEKDFLTTRVSYKFNLRGPSVNIQTACSTSLVAVHYACQSLLSYQCEIALAGGVSILLPLRQGYAYQEGWIASADGHCRAFDAKASGAVFGSAVGVVVLKRLTDALADGDNIYGVIKGSAINNDGSLKIGYTAPSVDGQAEVIAMAQAMAGVSPETITYIEAHGTGTPLGDPIEIKALNRVFQPRTMRKRFCAIGSVKTNIGHTDVAAGVAGLIKTVLALKHKQIPASLHFEEPNPQIDFANSPFYVNTELREWKTTNGHPRRAGVSSFGIGGTNAHVVLEEAPEPERSGESRPCQLMLLSAKTATALDAATANLARHLREHPDVNLADVSYTLQVGRKEFEHRRMVVCGNAAEAIEALEGRDPRRVFSAIQERHDRAVAFMFPGQGSQYVEMGRDLYTSEPAFGKHVDDCAELLKAHLKLDLRDVLYPERTGNEQGKEKLEQTWLAQPALFVIGYALAKMWMEWGIKPRAMIGHSVGEYVAACLAGVLSLEDALALLAARGRLMQGLPGGAMLSVGMGEEELRPWLGRQLSLAAINGPGMSVIAGPVQAVKELEVELEKQGTGYQRLHTSHAFHSAMMDPILEPFTRLVEKIKLKPAAIPYISNVTGTWITAGDLRDSSYWARHLREAVRFAPGIGELMKDSSLALLEVGPGQTLATLARRNAEGGGTPVALSSMRRPQEQQSDVAFMVASLGRLWLAGVPIDWSGFYSRERRHRLPLPTYPFERQRYWVEPEKPSFENQPSLDKKPNITDWFYVPCWKQAAPLASSKANESGRRQWLVFVDAGAFGDGMAKRLHEENQNVVIVSAREEFIKENDYCYSIRPERQEDYEALFEELRASQCFPDKIIHLWTLNDQPRSGLVLDRLERTQVLGFYSLLYLAQAIGNQGTAGALELMVLTSGLFDVTGEETLQPEKATILGPCKTIPLEYPTITCRLIDLDGLENGTTQQFGTTDRLLAEIMAQSANALVAYRGKHRWIQTFEPLPLTDPVEKQPRLRDGGVYLITGGLGGIGLTLAEYLARTACAKLVLVGRSSFPQKDKWEQWLASHGEGDSVSRKIRKVKSIKALGAEVLIVTADVADPKQMKAAIERAKQRFGAIHGVVHAAGIPGGGVMQLKHPAAAADVLSPKVTGTLVLDELLRDTTLDFFVLCSSILGLTSRVGQVDYCAANAFLGAFAHCKASKGNSVTISIDWDGWEEVGMAVDSSFASQEGAMHSKSVGRTIDHPLLDRLVLDTSDRLVYRTDFRVYKHWVLNEHRILGTAALPGTAYLEMARAAYKDSYNRERIEITDVYFLTPLMVGEDEDKAVFTVLERDGEVCDFRIISKVRSNEAGPSVWREHATGRIAELSQPAAPAAQEVFKVLDNGAGDPNEKEQAPDREEIVYWGPRWESVKTLNAGNGEVFARLNLPEEFSGDLEKFHLHPALLDVATSLGVKRASQDRYLPFSYQRMEVHGPLSGKLYSHVKLDASWSSGAETVTSDALIADQNGRVVVQIKGLALKRVDDDATALRDAVRNGDRALRDHARLRESEAQFYESLLGVETQPRTKFNGILPQEGVAAFNRILAFGIAPQVVVSVTDLHAVLDGPRVPAPAIEQASQQFSAGAIYARPKLQSSYAAPRTDSEQTLVNIWQEVLGIQQVGVNDNFFELGGDSVIAIQMVAKANKAGFQLAAAHIFQHQTIAELAAMVEADSRQRDEEVPIKDSNSHPQSSPLDDFGWTQGELDHIGRALRKTLN